MLKLVLDTNIYVAVALEPEGFCSSLLNEIINRPNDYKIFISPDIAKELRDKLESKNQTGLLEAAFIDNFLTAVFQSAKIIGSAEKIKAIKEDPDDDKILECAVSAEADIIVTMDWHLLKLKSFRNIGIVHPKTFFFMLIKK